MGSWVRHDHRVNECVYETNGNCIQNFDQFLEFTPCSHYFLCFLNVYKEGFICMTRFDDACCFCLQCEKLFKFKYSQQRFLQSALSYTSSDFLAKHFALVPESIFSCEDNFALNDTKLLRSKVCLICLLAV